MLFAGKQQALQVEVVRLVAPAALRPAIRQELLSTGTASAEGSSM
jgi:hypothetical protein